MIFDEAHNVIDALAQMHSIEMSYSEIEGASKLLTIYLEKYEVRLNPKNSLAIRQIMTVFKKLNVFIKERFNEHKKQNKLENIQESHQLINFLCNLHIEEFNFLHLSRFITQCQLSKKLFGFSKHLKTQIAGWNSFVAYKIKDFLDALAHINEDGTIIIALNSTNLAECSVKYHLLNVQKYFGEIMNEARNVIFIGGTMEPVFFLS